jgi:cbb3-type cytochrome c oxidase subunit III
MKHRIAVQVSGVLAATLLVVSGVLAATASKSGKEIYDRNCAFCHGVDGEADTPVGRILSPRPRRFADPVEMARLTDDQIYHAIKDGKPGTAMASWGKVLNESQIGDVMDYIHQLEGESKPMNEQQLSLAVGRRIYDKECAFCHGLNGDADTDAARVLKPPPRKFSDPIEMARVDDGRMYSAIKLGVPGSAMASWGSLMTPVEIIDVMRYIRTLTQPLPDVVTRDRLDVIVGGNIYQHYCVTCHGANGDADTQLGKVLVPHPRNFTSRKQMSKLTDQKMTDAIMHGRPGTAMASWGGILNPEDIRRVIRYIRATFSPTS